MKVDCYTCLKELDKKGALIISPPSLNKKGRPYDRVKKYHMCCDCFENLESAMSKIQAIKTIKKVSHT